MFSFSGFRDGHCHPLFASRESAGPNVDDCVSASEAVERIREFLAANPECTWVDSGSFGPALEASTSLTREMLDSASATVPIVVHAADHHSIWVNSAALAIAGLSETAPLLPHASFASDKTGRPSGRVFEWDAMSLIYAHQPAPSLESDLTALERAQDRLLAAGVVAVQEAWIDRGMPEAYLAAAAGGNLRIRVNLAPRIDPAQWVADLAFAKQTRSSVRNVDNPLLTCNTVKIFIDGVLGSSTAFLSEEYCAGGHGNTLWAKQELHAMCLAADSAGFQLHFHAIGDAAVDMAIDAVDYVDQTNGTVDRRATVAHADLASASALKRMSTLGIILCGQPAWAVPGADMDALVEQVGNVRSRLLHPFRAVLDARVPLSFGSDWPVSHPEPLPGMYSAITRCAPGIGDVSYESHQAISANEALLAYSTGTALQLGQETTHTDDEVVLSLNPITSTPAELLTATVVSVTVAGRKVWPKDS